MERSEKDEHLEIEPIDYAKIVPPPPHLKDMQVATKTGVSNGVVPMLTSQPKPASKKNPSKLVPFKQLGPGYETVVKLAGTEVLLRPHTNGTYQILGSFAPHMQSLFRPLNENETRAVKESGIICVK